jgi:histidinol-phosphate aminotransferase
MMERFIRPHFRGFTPYQSARSLVLKGEILLDANELSSGSPVSFAGRGMNRYPDPLQRELRGALAAYAGVGPDMIFTGVGSDEVIDLLVRLTCTPGRDSIAFFGPTYGLYSVAANVNDIAATDLELDDSFNIPPGYNAECSSNTRILFCCSPNNPTGNLLKRDDVLKLTANPDLLVVADQAYIEFAEGRGDLAADVASHPNLIVLRTLSKAWGLAGIRLGYCIAHPELVACLDMIKSPYNVSSLTSGAALGALADRSFVRSAVQQIVAERERMRGLLQSFPMVTRIEPSDANFLLVHFTGANRVFDALLKENIVVRKRPEPRLNGCLRLTIGTRSENDALCGVLEKIV